MRYVSGKAKASEMQARRNDSEKLRLARVHEEDTGGKGQPVRTRVLDHRAGFRNGQHKSKHGKHDHAGVDQRPLDAVTVQIAAENAIHL
jgi:hypothetical protein